MESHGILKSQKIANPVNLVNISITFLAVDRRALLLWWLLMVMIFSLTLHLRCNFSYFSLAKCPPRDLWIIAYKLWSAHAQSYLKCVLLHIILCLCVIETKLLCEKWRIAIREWYKCENKLGDRMIKRLLNSVIPKYRDLSVSLRWIFCILKLKLTFKIVNILNYF